MNQHQIRGLLLKFLKCNNYKNIVDNGLYIFAEGELPICLLAHMDTVFAKPPVDIYFDQEQHMMWSPQGLGADDRAGIYAIIRLAKMGFRPSIIFTDLEEQGGIGANWLAKNYPECPFKDCKALIQIDRRGSIDSVYYECANKEFEAKINSYGFVTNLGSFTDISIIAPAWNIAAVNLSTGYYNEHSPIEHLNIEELETTISKISFMLKHCSSWPKYDYVEAEGDGVWWAPDRCICCGKQLKENENHVCPGYDSKYSFNVCDECYAAYF